MNYHIALGRNLDLDEIEIKAKQHNCPLHIWCKMRQELNAQIHLPIKDKSTISDRFRSKLSSQPKNWTLAWELAEKLNPDDIIYCSGEDVSFPLAVACSKVKNPPRIATFAHNLDRPRARACLRFWKIANQVSHWFVCSKAQASFIHNFTGTAQEKITWIPDAIDTTFFKPGIKTKSKRPIIVSAGLEKRDYPTLAEATKFMDVDVKITGFSCDAKTGEGLFPKPIPSNMSKKFYPWTDLSQLYRDADIVVIPLHPNSYTAGINTLLEAWGSKRPVIISRTAGLSEYLINSEAAIQVEPGDAVGLAKTIQQVLKDDKLAEKLAQNGYDLVQKLYSQEKWLDIMLPKLKTM